MNNLVFYVPISSSGLAHYFAGGIILPANLYGNRPDDIQSSYSNLILVSKHKWINESDCSIEVILTNEEITKINEINDGIFQSPTPIPISRIKTIWFLDKEQLQTTVWNINDGTAFIPEPLLRIESKNPEKIRVDLKKIDPIPALQDLKDKTRQFDVILGGLAFMRVGCSPPMEYSKNYFKTLSFFNRLIRSEIEKVEINRGIKFSDAYHGLFTKKESEWTPWITDIYSEIDLEKIISIAKRKKEKVEIKYGMVQLDSLNSRSHFYELAIIATYGENKNKGINELVVDLENGNINPDKVEDIALVFGLNSGYLKFRNYYEKSKLKINVKFKMDSLVDYYTIESIFQYVFHREKENMGFDYLESWCPRFKTEKNLSGYETYNILDKSIILKKKPTYFEVFFQNYLQETNRKISEIIQNWIKPPLLIDEAFLMEVLRVGLSDTTQKALSIFESDLTRDLNALADVEKKELQRAFNKSKSEYEEKIAEQKRKIIELIAENNSLKEKYENSFSESEKFTKIEQEVASEIQTNHNASFLYQGQSEEEKVLNMLSNKNVEIASERVSEATVSEYKYIPENEGLNRESLKEKSVVQLKELGSRFGITYKGNKNEFIERILIAIKHNQDLYD